MRNIINTLMLLLFTTAVLSCSIAMDAEMAPEGAERSITVTGTASDVEDNKPLEEIRITLTASEGSLENPRKSTYTDNKGRFVIMMTGFSKPTSFRITAEDPNGIYQSATHEIKKATWNSDYNTSNGTFIVNDENFYLKKVR